MACTCFTQVGGSPNLYPDTWNLNDQVWWSNRRSVRHSEIIDGDDDCIYTSYQVQSRGEAIDFFHSRNREFDFIANLHYIIAILFCIVSACLHFCLAICTGLKVEFANYARSCFEVWLCSSKQNSSKGSRTCVWQNSLPPWRGNGLVHCSCRFSNCVIET